MEASLKHRPLTEEEFRVARVCIAGLAGRFPNCFTMVSKQMRPLKVGISKDLYRLMPPDEHHLIDLGLHFYTITTGYLLALTKVNAMRIDLEGNGIAPVDTNHVKWARMKLERRKKRSPSLNRKIGKT